MTRQHSTPLVISADAKSIVTGAALTPNAHGYSEDFIQDLVHRFPGVLPIAEIDPLFRNPVAICRELSTPAGSIDNLLITPAGLPILVECKLWKNPQGRREVVGQILDYSKELAKWSSSDLQREVTRKLGHHRTPIFELIKAAGFDVEEISFNDALTHNLRRGRFLLLILGDGIREGVEAIGEYLQGLSGLQFTFGLVEFPVYQLPDQQRIIVPRVLARTRNIVRNIIAVPEGYSVNEDDRSSSDEVDEAIDPKRAEFNYKTAEARQAFWKSYFAGLTLDDAEQMLPPAGRGPQIYYKFGAQGGSLWLTAYQSPSSGHVGIFLSSNRNSVGERASQMLGEYEADLRSELPDAEIDFSTERPRIAQKLLVGDLNDPMERERALAWLREKTNVFINALRPRIKTVLARIAQEG